MNDFLYFTEILSKIVSASETFTLKTEYSQAKFLKKKEKVYGDTLTFSRPTLSLLADLYFTRDNSNSSNSTNFGGTTSSNSYNGSSSANRICSLRADTLGQLLNYANVVAGAKIILYETGGSYGLVLGALLSRLGGLGTLVHIAAGNMPKRDAVYHLNLGLSALKPLTSLDVFYLIRPMPQPKQTKDVKKYKKLDNKTLMIVTYLQVFISFRRKKVTMDPQLTILLLKKPWTANLVG